MSESFDEKSLCEEDFGIIDRKSNSDVLAFGEPDPICLGRWRFYARGSLVANSLALRKVDIESI